MNKNMYKYNEKKYAEFLLEKRKLSKNVTNDLKILAKYYKLQGKKISEIRDLIISFCEENINHFNIDIHFKMINKVINYVKKDSSNLLVIEHIPITDKEFEFANTYDGSIEEKTILLGLIIQNKLNKTMVQNAIDINTWNNYFGGDDKGNKEIKRNCSLKNIKILEVFLHKLYNQGLIEVKSGFKTKLKFIENISESNNVLHELKVLNNYNLLFEKLNGSKNITECQVCGELVKKKSNKTKYCKVCDKFVKNEQNKYYYNLGK